MAAWAVSWECNSKQAESQSHEADAADNNQLMAEAFNSLFKAECIRNPVMRPKGGWKSISDVEIAVADYVDWFNHRRLHGEIGLIPPAEFETNHWASQPAEPYAAVVPAGVETSELSLYETRGDSWCSPSLIQCHMNATSSGCGESLGMGRRPASNSQPAGRQLWES